MTTPKPLTAAEVAALEAAVGRMTPGPWTSEDGEVWAANPAYPDEQSPVLIDAGFDRDGIAALRNAAPVLIAQLREAMNHVRVAEDALVDILGSSVTQAVLTEDWAADLQGIVDRARAMVAAWGAPAKDAKEGT